VQVWLTLGEAYSQLVPHFFPVQAAQIFLQQLRLAVFFISLPF